MGLAIYVYCNLSFVTDLIKKINMNHLKNITVLMVNILIRFN